MLGTLKEDAMSDAYQQKLDRFAARYTDGGVPMDSRHVLELCSDLHDLISSLMGRVAILEEQVTSLNQRLG